MKIPLRKQDWQQTLKYQVTFDDFTERHYVKKFIKRYSARVWNATKVAIGAICMNAEMSVTTEKLETISHQGNVLLCKLYFSVAGTGKSPKGSGNRCIVVVDTHSVRAFVLLVYHKNDLVGVGNETVKWKRVIKDNYPQYGGLV